MAGNQYKADPRQKLFKAYYTDPTSETFSNAQQSALRAGYSEEYSKNITGQGNDWFSEIIRDHSMLQKAERNIVKFLDDDEDKKIQADITKFVAKALNKEKYSDRKELTGPEGGPLVIGWANESDDTVHTEEMVSDDAQFPGEVDNSSSS